MKKNFKIIMLLLLLMVIFPVYADETTTLAINSEDVTINNKTDQSDAKYSFTLKANKSTAVSYFTLEGNTEKKYTDVKDFPIQGYEHIYYVNPDNSLTGKFGAWIKNVGIYHGKIVDVKLIYSWKAVGDVNPSFGIGIDAEGGLLALRYTSVSVNYQLYSENKPINVDMSLTFCDIDGYQTFGFKNDTGTINKIETVSDSVVHYGKKDGYSWFYDGTGEDFPDRTFYQPASIRLELKSTKSFTIVYVSGDDYFNYMDVPRLFKNDINDASALETAKNKYLQLLTQFSDSFIGNNESHRVNTGLGFFTANAYTEYTIPAPIKYVSDSDEKKLLKNNLKQFKEEYTYDVYVQVPLEDESNFYSGWKVEDVLSDNLEYKSTKVYNDGLEDITDKFNISFENNTLKVVAKDTKISSFYNNTYDIKVTVSSKGNNNDSIFNTANVIVERNGKVCDNCSQTSNKTETVLPYLITTEVVNGTIDDEQIVPAGETRKINYSPKEGYTLSSIEVDGKSVSIDQFKDFYTFEKVNANHKIKVVYINNPKTGMNFIYFVGIIAVACFGAVMFNYKKSKSNEI